jgi:predicted nucleic acid-binding protein
MRILIDTNIFIYREDDHIIPGNLQKLLKALHTLGTELLVHPKSIEEIRRDSNENRKKVKLSKIAVYPVLELPPNPDKDDNFINVVGYPQNPNDRVDNALLYAVYKNAVDFLITEDRGVQKKADKLNLEDRVLSIGDALGIFGEKSVDKKIGRPPALKEEFLYNLDVYDSFFDSLKEEYPEFDEWFREKSRQGRKCWVYLKDDNTIGALLIYKIENEPIDSDPPLPRKKRLKLCTFKATVLGRKIGELFIKLSVEYSIKNSLEEIYLTHFTKEEDYLVDLITEYGFYNTARNRRGEDVYIKELFPDREKLRSLSPVEVSKKFWPSFYDGSKVRKFIVPIRPEYHDRLFIEYRGRQTRINEHLGQFIIEGNTIKKAYLCHSRISKIYPGDVLLFYRSHDHKELTSLGVIEQAYLGLRDKDKIMRYVGRRTVYSVDEVERMTRKPVMVILFTWHFHFPNPIKFDDLKKMRVLSGAPQSIMGISHKQYCKIKRKGGIDGRFTVD